MAATFAGLQGCRTNGTRIRSSSHFWRVPGGALKGGQLGCEAWIAKEIPMSDGSRVVVKAEHLVLRSFSTRHVWVSMRSHQFSFDILALHAPTTGETTRNLHSFWDKIDHVVAKNKSKHVLFIAADINGRVGSQVSGAVGSAHPDEEDTSGSRFHMLLDRHEMCIPTTFQCFDGGGLSHAFP